MNESSPFPYWFWLLLVALAAALLAVAWWDWTYPYSMVKWWQGERLYPYHLNQLKLALAVSGAGSLVLWALGGLLAPRATGRRVEQGSLPFALAVAVLPFFARYAWHPMGVQPGSSVWTYLLVIVTAGVATPAVARVLRLLCAPLCRRGWAVALVWMLVALYVVLFGWLSVARHTQFRSHALDLGTMEQAAWNTLRGRPLERTPLYRDPAGGSRYENRLLDAKLELILLPISLLYGLRGDVRVLLWVQALALGLGAIPLYKLLRDLRRAPRGNTAAGDSGAVPGTAGIEALLLAAAYLIYLPLHYVQMADFHPSVLMIGPLIAAWRAMRLGRWRAYYAWLGLALCCRVDAAFCALGLGLVMLLWRPRPLVVARPPRRGWRRVRRRTRAKLGTDETTGQERTAAQGVPSEPSLPQSQKGARKQAALHGLLTLALAAAWLALDFGVIVPLVRRAYGPGAGDLVTRRFGALGDNPLDIARTVLTHPLFVVSLLAQRDKLQALFDLLAPAGLLPLLGPWAWLPALPITLINLLAGSAWQQSVHAHYMAPVIAFVWIAAAEGLAGIARDRAPGAAHPVAARGSRLRRALAAWLRWAMQGTHLATCALLCALLVAVVISPYPPGLSFSLANYWPGRGRASSYREAQRAVVAAVPAGASVCAQSDLHPHLARRREVALFPYCRLEGDQNAEYVLLDLDASSVKSPLDYHSFYKLATAWLSMPEYGVVEQQGGVLLLQRGASRDTMPQVLDALDTYGRDFYHVTWVQAALPARVDRENLYRVQVILRNVGSQTWHSQGQLPVRLSYRWWTESGALLLEDPLRTDLPHRVEPGHEVRLRAHVHTPRQPGRYILEWDLVREGDAWFGDMGAIMLRQEVVIQ